MDRNTVCYCIDVIRSVMQGAEVPALPEGVPLDALFAFAKMHSVEAMVYHGLCSLKMDESDPIWQHWQNRAQMLLTQSIVQLADRDALLEAMAEAGVWLLPVKGCWLKEAYPEIDYRQMSDLDILIRREDRAKARQVMLSLGYREENAEIATHHDGYEKKPYTAVELHLQLLPVELGKGDYYDGVWERARPVAGQPLLHRFSAEDEYIYYFLHMKKHMDDAGCGVRSILDSVVFRQTYPGMDRAYLQNEFEKLGIADYVRAVERLADCWFVTGEPLPEALFEMADGVLMAGVYGRAEDVFKKRMDRLREKYKNPAVRMIAYWIPRVFRPLEVMRNDYPVLDRLPALLPVFWLVHIARKCVTKPRAVLHHIRQIFREGTRHGED